MILVNGVATAEISVRDRGLAFGDGVFETIAVIGTRVMNWSQHLARLQHGCARLDIPVPDADLLLSEIHTIAATAQRVVVKLIITRGDGGEGYTPPPDSQPHRIVLSRPWPRDDASRAEHGVALTIAQHRLSENPLLAGLKHLNRLDQVMASREVAGTDCVDALMLDQSDRLIETTRCNVFLSDGVDLLTPDLRSCGVAGVMRGIVMALAGELSLRPREAALSMEMLRGAQEVFICNAIAGIWPVVSIARGWTQSYAIGEITRSLQAALRTGGYRP